MRSSIYILAKVDIVFAYFLRENNTLFVFRNTGVNGAGFILQYNEYIVYKTNQIKMKYLAKIKFNHKY